MRDSMLCRSQFVRVSCLKYQYRNYTAHELKICSSNDIDRLYWLFIISVGCETFNFRRITRILSDYFQEISPRI